MKKTLRFSRANFPNTTMLYWATYFVSILEQKYTVIIDSDNPDIVLYSNLNCNVNEIDKFTRKNARLIDSYDSKVKKIFCSGENVTNYQSIVNSDDNYFVIGPGPFDHPRYLRLQLHNTTAAWGLYKESELFSNPYSWLTQSKNAEEILTSKKYFCGVVQNSTIPYRLKLYEKLTEYKPVRASGGWITNVPPEEATITHPTIDGEGYKSKVLFLKNCKFSIQVQSSDSDYFTHEKMIHAYAANTIPIFYGNSKILEDGFNPESFINGHDFESIEDVVERVKEIDSDNKMYKKIISASYFVDNKLPYYYDPEYVLEFIERVFNS
jgi:hypothetical protein